MINKHTYYNIKIQGHLDEYWQAWFDELNIILTPDGNTILNGAIIDQSALYGVLKKINNVGLTLISVIPHSQQNKENKMNILIVGASGATGRLLTEQLLKRGHLVKIIVRSPEKLPETVKNHENVTIIHAAVLDLSEAEMIQHVKGCDAVASCLGHNLTFKGIYGPPYKLVTDATRRLCQAIRANNQAGVTKFVLMNTTGNSNRDLNEPLTVAEKAVITLLRLLLPPHVDNEKAADYLRCEVGQNDSRIEWVAVRPDGLLDEDTVTDYELHPSPIMSALFDSGKTSRINVAHFMADLITNETCWEKWKGQMPVIYNLAEDLALSSANIGHSSS